MVKFLATYMNDRTARKDCSYFISIKEEVEKYQRYNPRKKPVVIFDFVSCLAIPILNKYDIFCGGRQTICTSCAIEFCEKFKEIGVEMIFFVDGPIKQSKIPRYLENSNKKYETQQEIFDSVRNETSISCWNTYRMKLSSFADNFLHIARKYGKIYISLENECDLDLAEYATRIQAMAIFTPDTDFLIYRKDWQVWSSVHFNLQKFKTTAWNKFNMRKHLKLNLNQMSIFATLAGNDYFTYDEVKNLSDNCNGRDVSLEKLANFVNINFPRGVPISQQDMTKLIDMLSNNITNNNKDNKNKKIVLSKPEIKAKVQQSLDFYEYSSRKIAKVESWLLNHIKYTSSIIVYTILKNFPITINQSWIDLRVPNLKPFADLVIPIVQRQMGICLYDKRMENVKRTFYYKPNHEEPFQAGVFGPIYPNDDICVPALTDILYFQIDSTGEESDSGHLSIKSTNEVVSLEEKFKLLAWLISSKSDQIIGYEKIMEIRDSKLLEPALITYYLVQESQITIEEADVILLSIHEAMNSTKQKMKSIPYPEIYKQRSFALSFIYNRFCNSMLNSLVICGLFEFANLSYFDGLIFHKMLEKFPNLDEIKKLELIEPIKQYRIYTKDI